MLQETSSTESTSSPELTVRRMLQETSSTESMRTPEQHMDVNLPEVIPPPPPGASPAEILSPPAPGAKRLLDEFDAAAGTPEQGATDAQAPNVEVAHPPAITSEVAHLPAPPPCASPAEILSPPAPATKRLFI